MSRILRRPMFRGGPVGYQQPQAPVSPLSTALGIGTGIASIGSKLGLFGK